MDNILLYTRKCYDGGFIYFLKRYIHDHMDPDLYNEEELEELIDLFDYGTPLWGGLLGTGDETPTYPYVFGGAGALALLALLLIGRKRRKNQA